MNSSGQILIQADHGQKIKEAVALLSHAGKRSVWEIRKLILGLESAMLAMPEHLTAEDFKTHHHFAPGIYMRELVVPPNMIMIGKIHKTEHLNIMSKGQVTVWTEDGIKTLSGPTTMKSMPGIKRAGYTQEGFVWTTIHPNLDEERDIKKLEARLLADTFDEAYLASPKEFKDAIHFLGFTPEEVKTMSENTDDQIPFLSQPNGIRISESPIHGLGVFATKVFEKGSFIALARIQGKRTPVGRHVNHGSKFNSEMIMVKNGDVYLIASSRIEADEEILNDYYLSFVNTRDTSFKEGVHLCLV